MISLIRQSTTFTYIFSSPPMFILLSFTPLFFVSQTDSCEEPEADAGEALLLSTHESTPPLTTVGTLRIGLPFVSALIISLTKVFNLYPLTSPHLP